MKPHSAEFKEAIKQMGRELRGVITYGNTTLEEEIMSITPHYEANLLKSVMKQLDLELSVDIPLETVINCQIGILVDEEYEMLNFGNYVVYSSEKQEDTKTYKIVCYDKLLYSMKQNEDLGVTYPITIKNYLTALATKIGLTVASGTFYNQDLQIPSELYVGLDYTYRDILDEIAQATGSIITLNNNDEIEVRYPNDLGSTATVNGTNLTIAEHSNNIIVNAIISGNSVQDGTPTPTNPVEIETAGDQINYFNKDTILAGHLINSNGTITEDSYNFVSDYIEVDSDREYTISAVTNKAKRIAYYNSEQTFISRPVVSNYSGTVTTPSNAKYVRLSCNNDDLNSLQFYNTIGEIPLTISNSDNTQSQEFTIPCQQPMRSIGNVRDGFIKQDGVWYEKHNIGVIESYNGETITTDYMSTTGELSTGAFVQYVLGTPNYIQCADEQIQVLNAILNASLYTGVTNIVSDAYLSITYNSASEIIDEEYLKDVNVDFGQMYGKINSIVLSRAGGSDNVYIQDEESVEENGLCEVKIVDNQIMNFNNRSDYLQGLLAALDGLYYYINDFNSTGILYYDVGDLYNVQIGENTYQCLMLNDEITVTTGIEERIYTDMPEQSQTDYSKADKTDRRINQTYIIVDKQNQTISSVVSNVDGQNSKISQINQRLDGLESSVQDIADITTYGESQIAVVNLSDINESEPIMLKVRPITKNISKLYPKGNLYPSSNQYLNTRIVNFKRTYTEEGVTKTEDIPYELPDDLLYYDSNYYDEFYLDYDSQTCQITKRCEWAGGVNNIINPADIINYSDIGGISSITYDKTETFKVIFDNEDGGNIRVSKTYFKFQSDSITISLQNLVNVDIRMIIYYYNGDTMLGYSDFTGSIATIHNNDINGNIANRWQLYLLFYNVSVNQECRFNLMVNTGTTALPFETFNAIVVPKDQEQAIDYSYPAILLGDGDYEISLAGYDIGYLFVRLMAQNIYTRQFATQAQLSSRIEQTAEDITLSVDRKLTNYSTTNEMQTEIRATAEDITSTVRKTYATKNETNSLSSRIKQTAKSIELTTTDNGTSAGITIRVRNEDGTQIDSDTGNITLSGLVKFTDLSRSGSTTINGSNITTGTINGNNVNVTNINASNITSGTISGSKISGGTIDGEKVTIKNLDASKITTGTLSASKISGGTLNGDNMTVKNLKASSITAGTLNGIPVKNSTISSSSISGTSISGGSLSNTPYSFSGDSSDTVSISSSTSGTIEGYYGSKSSSNRRYSLKAFTSGGRFQSFNSSGGQASYFDHQGAHTVSDIRLKNNISNIEQQKSMNIINNLTPIEFTYKADETEYHRGLSAQEVEQVLKNNGIEKEIYEIRENGDYSLNYSELIPDLINCIKYLTKEIEKLKGGK